MLTSGADPTQYLLSLGKQQGYETGSNLKMVSLGQGQGPIAERLIITITLWWPSAGPAMRAASIQVLREQAQVADVCANARLSA